MVWGGLEAGGTTPLAFIEGRQDAKSYIELLKLNMKPYGEDICGDSWYFQQNNATSLSFSLCIPSQALYVMIVITYHKKIFIVIHIYIITTCIFSYLLLKQIVVDLEWI